LAHLTAHKRAKEDGRQDGLGQRRHEGGGGQRDTRAAAQHCRQHEGHGHDAQQVRAHRQAQGQRRVAARRLNVQGIVSVMPVKIHYAADADALKLKGDYRALTSSEDALGFSKTSTGTTDITYLNNL
jgi:hypothetical protein